MQLALEDIVAQAQHALQRGEFAAATALLRDPARLRPGDAGLQRLYGLALLRKGDVAAAREAFERVAALVPNDVDAHKDLGVALAAQGELEAALVPLRRALELDSRAYLARLHLARTLERLGREDEALPAYFGALHYAQEAGRWRNDATTPPLLRDLVTHAMEVVDAGRRQLFELALAPLRARFPAADFARLDAALASFLGEQPATPSDPAQRPLFWYFPGLPSTRFFARELFPWIADFEANTAAIREELLAVLAEEQGFVPFLGNDTAEQVSDQLAGSRGEPAWNAFFFYRHGQRYAENCARCPRTAAILDGLPLVRIREHAPEICFSVLTPGSHILPHTGVTNTRVVCHLPLIVPEECAIVVGGETHAWREGRAVVFDDTFEHEAWNRSERVRVVLLMDLWNPHLTAAEREGLALLVGAIGDFNARAGLPR